MGAQLIFFLFSYCYIRKYPYNLNMLKSKVTVYRLPWASVSSISNRENWFTPRETYFNFNSSLVAEAAAEEAFIITNAPAEVLNSRQKRIIKNFHGPSMSVGDVVKVDRYLRQQGDTYVPEYYLCKSFGWEKYNDCNIELNKYID